MTAEEFDAAEQWEEGYRYELVDGVLIVSPPASEGERGPNDLLGYLLQFYRRNHPQGSSLDYTLPEHLIVTRRNRRIADRVIWAVLARKPRLRGERRDPPTIAIEYVSRDKRDRERDYVQKRREYTEIGMSEYWIIDRFQRRMTVVHFGDQGETETVIAENETYTTPLLPGFELHLRELLDEADWLEADDNAAE